MSKKIKIFKSKTITLVITSFLFTLSGSAMAFNDVAESSWYSSYVDELTHEGVFTDTENFRPDDPVNRAELVKIIITAIKGLGNYEENTQAHFSDVPTDSWFYPYVEAAFRMGIVNGYQDELGSPSGKFGPNDLVTRAAATKVLIHAFEIELEPTTTSAFKDIDSSMWFYNYVNTAQKHALISGYADGRFGAGDPVTRAQIAKMISLAKNKMGSSEDSSNKSEEKNQNTLTINQLPLAIKEQTVPRGTSIPLVQYSFTAGEADVKVEKITVTRSGVGNADDWLGAFVYAGLLKVSSEHSFGKDSNQATIPVRMVIPAKQTIIVTIYADTSLTSVPGNEHFFQIQSKDDIEANAAITGDFNNTGFKITIGNLYPNVLTVKAGSTPARPRGPNSEVAAIKAIAGNQGDIQLKALILTKSGSVNDDEVTDCHLYTNDDHVATTPGLYEGQIIFTFEKVFILKAGQQTNLYARCNVATTASRDTIKFYLDESYDFVTTDLDFGYPAVPLNSYNQDNVTELIVR